MIIPPILTTSVIHVSLKGWENVLLNLGMRGLTSSARQRTCSLCWSAQWNEEATAFEKCQPFPVRFYEDLCYLLFNPPPSCTCARYSTVGNRTPHRHNVFFPPSIPEPLNVQYLESHIFPMNSYWSPPPPPPPFPSPGPGHCRLPGFLPSDVHAVVPSSQTLKFLSLQGRWDPEPGGSNQCTQGADRRTRGGDELRRTQ